LPGLKPTIVFETYWNFTVERQNIFFKKLRGQPGPWTEDLILKEYKFTNAYRAADRVSQYLIKNVIYRGDQAPEELFFRIILFKLFNRIDTWELLEKHLGGIRYADYSFEKYDRVLSAAQSGGKRIFSGAYIMPSGCAQYKNSKKHRSYLKLVEKMMCDALPSHLVEADSMFKAFELLRSYPMIGDFLAYQYVIDINYSEMTSFSEMEFVKAGPGAKAGIRKCFEDSGGLSEEDIIRYVTEHQEEEFLRRDMKFQTLWGRTLQLIDCQNLFCEVDKYARLAHPEVTGQSCRTRIKQKYRPNDEPIEYWFPPNWGLVVE